MAKNGKSSPFYIFWFTMSLIRSILLIVYYLAFLAIIFYILNAYTNGIVSKIIYGYCNVFISQEKLNIIYGYSNKYSHLNYVIRFVTNPKTIHVIQDSITFFIKLISNMQFYTKYILKNVIYFTDVILVSIANILENLITQFNFIRRTETWLLLSNQVSFLYNNLEDFVQNIKYKLF
ncbi:hypothetical protein A3Q56_01849 [Intoshia linei]|uniref:Uncharacterized protein n=1 Tax=Intoshia linei TaxID=1819745 RepID=A0A177B8E0_9BILA|nr:hypothetical protein A3Q56_01849 [Intoshia linei]